MSGGIRFFSAPIRFEGSASRRMSLAGFRRPYGAWSFRSRLPRVAVLWTLPGAIFCRPSGTCGTGRAEFVPGLVLPFFSCAGLRSFGPYPKLSSAVPPGLVARAGRNSCRAWSFPFSLAPGCGPLDLTRGYLLPSLRDLLYRPGGIRVRIAGEDAAEVCRIAIWAKPLPAPHLAAINILLTLEIFRHTLGAGRRFRLT